MRTSCIRTFPSAAVEVIGSKYNLNTRENTSPQRANARGRLLVSWCCDFARIREYMKRKHHFGGKMELSELLPWSFIISSLLSLHDQFHPRISLLFLPVVTNRADPEFQVRAVPGEKRGWATLQWTFIATHTVTLQFSTRSFRICKAPAASSLLAFCLWNHNSFLFAAPMLSALNAEYQQCGLNYFWTRIWGNLLYFLPPLWILRCILFSSPSGNLLSDHRCWTNTPKLVLQVKHETWGSCCRSWVTCSCSALKLDCTGIGWRP